MYSILHMQTFQNAPKRIRLSDLHFGIPPTWLRKSRWIIMVYGREGSKNYSPTFVDPRGHGGGGGTSLKKVVRNYKTSYSPLIIKVVDRDDKWSA